MLLAYHHMFVESPISFKSGSKTKRKKPRARKEGSSLSRRNLHLGDPLSVPLINTYEFPEESCGTNQPRQIDSALYLSDFTDCEYNSGRFNGFASVQQMSSEDALH